MNDLPNKKVVPLLTKEKAKAVGRCINTPTEVPEELTSVWNIVHSVCAEAERVVSESLFSDVLTTWSKVLKVYRIVCELETKHKHLGPPKLATSYYSIASVLKQAMVMLQNCSYILGAELRYGGPYAEGPNQCQDMTSFVQRANTDLKP